MGSEKRSMDIRGKTSKALLFLLPLGLGLNLTWCNLMGHAAGFFPSSAEFGVLVNPRTFFLVGIFITSLAFSFFPGTLRHNDKSLKYIIPLVSAGGTACFAISYSQTIFDPLLLSIIGLSVSGIGYSWLVSRFILLIIRALGFNWIVWSVSGSLIVMLLTAIPLELLNDVGWQILIATTLPIFIALIFGLCRSLLAKKQKEESAEARELLSVPKSQRTTFGIAGKPRKIAVSRSERSAYYFTLFAAALLLAVIRALGSLGTWGNTGLVTSLTDSWILETAVLILCISIFAYVALVRTKNYSIEIRFIPAIAVIFAGMFIAVIQANQGEVFPGLLNSFLYAADLLAHLLFWSVVATVLDRLDVPSYRVLGIAGVTYSAVSILWVILLGNTTIVNSTFISLTTYGLLVVALASIWVGIKRSQKPQQDTQFDFEQKKEADPTETIALRCAVLAEEYKLSPREKEVFFYLAQGRTREFIKDELVLSGSTVKTHVSHIYTKLEVADKQEMMDLLWKKDTAQHR